jgi:hypothetical protein
MQKTTKSLTQEQHGKWLSDMNAVLHRDIDENPMLAKAVARNYKALQAGAGAYEGLADGATVDFQLYPVRNISDVTDGIIEARMKARGGKIKPSEILQIEEGL